MNLVNCITTYYNKDKLYIFKYAVLVYFIDTVSVRNITFAI